MATSNHRDAGAGGLLRRAMRARPRLCALALGVSAVLVLLLVAEVVLRVIHIGRGKPDSPYPKALIVKDAVLGYKPKAHGRCRVALLSPIDETKIQETVYSIDAHSRRLTPMRDSGDRKAFALFFGGSVTFGQSVNDDETMPCCFGRFSARYRPYNYGFCGYGPQAMLAKLQSEEIPGEVPQRSGIAVYTFIDGHIDRAIGSMCVHNLWGAHMPYYTLDSEGALVRRGDFTTGRPAVACAYWLLGQSAVIKELKVDFPRRIGTAHLDLTCRIIEEAKREFERQFHSEGFFVLFYPGSTYGWVLIPRLEASGVRCIDYSRLSEYASGPYVVPGDGHPSALCHHAIARRLALDIETRTSRRAAARR